MPNSKRNPWFNCEEFGRKTTRGRCMKYCYVKDKEKCIAKNIQEDLETDRIKSMEKEKCPKCGSYLVSSLYFAFCPTCGLSDDEGEE